MLPQVKWLLKLLPAMLLLAALAMPVFAGQVGDAQVTMEQLRTCNEIKEPLLLGKTVTVSGVAVVDSGKWHDSANYFALVESEAVPRGVLVYLPGTTKPMVHAGDRVRVTGVLSTRGYSTDTGAFVIIPSGPDAVEILSSGNCRPEGYRISTNPADDVLEGLQGSYVRVEGRVSQYRNTGIVRGFWVDGSSDGNIEDRKGTMYVKFYNYAGIDINHLHNGSYVVISGILVKADERHGRYYIRPTRQEDIVEIPEKTRPPGPDEKPPGLTYDLGKPGNLKELGLFELVRVETSMPLLREMYPDWRPDGSGLTVTLGKEQGARITSETAETNLFLLQFTGGVEPHQLTYEFFPHAYPRWSPDGKRIAYAAAPGIDGPSGNWNIYVTDLEGEVKQVTSDPGYEFAPAWAGEGLIYTTDARGNWDLYWAAGEGAFLTSDPADEGFPDWSSGQVLFQRRGEDGRFDIWKGRVEFSDGVPRLVDEVCLTPELMGSNVYPRWSPEGDRIAFMSSVGGSWDIWLMDEHGKDKHRLTSLPGSELYPAWDPSGRRLAFVRDNGRPGIWVIDVKRALKAEVALEERTAPHVVVKRDTNQLTFAIIADIHLNNRFVGPENRYLPAILEELNQIQPDFAVLLGDLVGKNADRYPEEYPQLHNILLERAHFPIYAVMGNHDGRTSGDIDGFAFWESFFGPLYHSKYIGNWKFIFLNTYDYPQFPSDNGVIGEQQLLWLRGELEEAQVKGAPIAVFLHHNPFDTRWVFMDEGREQLRNLLEVYGVSLVFAGHRHTDQLEYSPTTAIITTRTAQNGPADEVGYRLVTIDGTSTTYRRTSSVISTQ